MQEEQTDRVRDNNVAELGKYTQLIVGVIIGGLLGYGVYRFIGCSSGACPITSNPWISTIFGMVIGALISRAI